MQNLKQQNRLYTVTIDGTKKEFNNIHSALYYIKLRNDFLNLIESKIENLKIISEEYSERFYSSLIKLQNMIEFAFEIDIITEQDSIKYIDIIKSL